MQIFESEQMLGLFFLELTKLGVRKVTEEEIYDFNFKFLVEMGSNKGEGIMCRIDRRDIIKFTDKFSNFLTYSFNLRNVTIKYENSAIMLRSFNERYVKGVSDELEYTELKEKAELMNVIRNVIDEMIAKFCREAVIYDRQMARELLNYIQRETCTLDEIKALKGCIYNSRETVWQRRIPYLKDYKLVRLEAMNFIEFEPLTRCELDTPTLLEFYNNPEMAEEFANDYFKTLPIKTAEEFANDYFKTRLVK